MQTVEQPWCAYSTEYGGVGSTARGGADYRCPNATDRGRNCAGPSRSLIRSACRCVCSKIVDMPVPQIGDEIVEMVSLTSATGDRRAIVDVPFPHIKKTIVEVVGIVGG